MQCRHALHKGLFAAISQGAPTHLHMRSSHASALDPAAALLLLVSMSPLPAGPIVTSAKLNTHDEECSPLASPLSICSTLATGQAWCLKASGKPAMLAGGNEHTDAGSRSSRPATGGCSGGGISVASMKRLSSGAVSLNL